MEKTPSPKSARRQRAKSLSSDSPTGTLEKGLLLLGLFDAGHPEWSIKEIGERAGLPKVTVWRLMKTLEASNWVEYDATSQKYHLGRSVLRLLYLAASPSELVRVTHPFLVRLAEETTESCSLTVWTDVGPMIVDTVPTSRHFKPLTYKGMVLEGLASADAQVFVAFGPEDAWDALLAKPIEPRTPKTVTDPELLRERWRAVRRDGVAFDRGGWKLEAPAVAAPVFNRVGELRGAIHVVPPVERASEEELQRYAAMVKATAAQISEHLG
jgi:DNA-binding IclR family transcriptional regulator